MNVLIVDDNSTNRKLLRVTLVAEGVHTLEAADGVEALAVLEHEPVDAVISDILMPGMDGFRLCHAIRKHPRLANLPFLIYSATYTSPGDEQLALDSGADRYLRKPCPVPTILAALREVCSQAREGRTPRSSPIQELEVTRQYSQALVKKLEEKNAELEILTSALAAERERLAITLHSIGDAVIATDVAGRVTMLNGVAEALTGWTQAEAVRRPLTEVFRIVHEQTQEPVEDPVAMVIKLGKVAELANHTVLISRQGKRVSVADSAAPILNPAGETIGVVLVFRDVTQERRAQRERDLTAEFLRLVNESAHSADLLRMAASFFKQHSRCECVGIRLRQSDDFPYVETRGFNPDFVIAENALCARDHDGKPLRHPSGTPVLECLCGSVISGRFDPAKSFFTPGGSFWTNSTTRFLASNSDADGHPRTRPHCNRAGYESVALLPIRAGQERLGLLQLNDHRPGMFSPELVGLWERLAGHLAIALAKLIAEEALHKSHAELEQRVLERTQALSKVNDELRGEIQVRHQAEAAVQIERRRLQDVLEMLPAYVVLLTADYHVAFANRFFRERFGESNGKRCFEYLFNRSEPCEVCTTYTVLKNQAPTHWEWTGPDHRQYDIFDFPFTDNDGSPLILEMGIDITERKKAEAGLRELVAELEHFSYTITHDMRAPLRAMRGFAGLLEGLCSDCLSPEKHDYLHRIETSAKRMDQLITDSLNYSRAVKQEWALSPTDPGALLRGMIDSYPTFQKPNADIQILGSIPRVLANEAGLTQCFSNLLDNAVKFVQHGRLPQVRIHAERLDCPEPSPREPAPATRDAHQPFSLSHPQPQPLLLQPNIRVWFEDNGIGISDHFRPRLFHMFQRESKHYEGTGVGLALVKKVVERMGGRVGVESEPGQGSRFWIDLRAVER